MAAAPVRVVSCFKFAVTCIILTIVTLGLITPALGSSHVAQETFLFSHSVDDLGASLTDVIRPIGARVRLRCPVKAHRVWWTKDRTHKTGHIGQDSEIIACSEGGCESTLRLINVSSSDAGIYKCWTALKGPVTPAFRLKITEHRPRRGRPPQMIGPEPKHTSVVVGGSTTLRCQVHSYTPTNLKWLRKIDHLDGSNSALINALSESRVLEYEGKTYEMVKGGSNASLSNGMYITKLPLTHVSSEDEGEYVCLAANNNGFRYRPYHVIVLPASPTVIPAQQKGVSEKGALLIIGPTLVTAASICIVLALCRCSPRQKTQSAQETRRTLMS